MSENAEVLVIESISGNALSVFTGEVDTLDSLLLQIEAEALSLVPDTSTAKGRDVIRSNAANVARAKIRIDKEGKLLADKQKEIPRLIDASRKKAREFLEDLQEKVRAPLTEFEEKQKRDEAEAERIAVELLAAEQAQKDFLADWDNAIFLNDKFDFEKEKAEAAKVKQAEQDKKDRAIREAELIEQGKKAAEQSAKDAIEKAEREKAEAEQREKQAVENARIAADNAKRLADEQARQAVESARKHTEAEAAKQKAIADKKAENKRHQAKINNAIKVALIANGFSEDDAAKIITLSVKRELGRLIIDY